MAARATREAMQERRPRRRVWPHRRTLVLTILMSLAPGTRLGPYEITGVLGAGGMGEVYRAHDPRLQRDIAIKVLSADTVSDATARARLLREARSAAALNHPQVCTIHEVSEAGGLAFIAMELVEGESLDAVIPADGLPLDRVLQVGAHVAEAVGHAHSRGIVHRDLKPSNVRLTPEQRVKVLDFGLARRMSREDLTDATTATGSALTEAGGVLGTIPYMAPEQLRGQPADPRSDVWALGAMLYELASGTRPFRGETSFEVSSAILSASPPPLPSRVPATLRAVIDRCLDKIPDRRYQHAGEVHAALDAIRAGAVTTWHAWRYRAGRRPWRTLAAGTGIVAAVLVAALAVGGLRSRVSGGAGSEASPLRLAVLPFENLTGDPAQDYLTDGMTEEMIGQLGRLNSARLRVIARTSSMAYKGTTKSPEEIGRELQVDYLLESSVRREGDRVRINSALIRVSDQTQRWTDSFERDLSGLFALQDEVARGVTGSLALTLLPDEQDRIARARPVDPRAYEAYLKGRMHWYRMTPEDIQLAKGYFERALDIDRDYALAYVGLADALALPGHLDRVPVHEAFGAAKVALAKALELDDGLAEAVDLDARIKFAYDWDWTGADAGFRRAIRLNPNYPDARIVYGQLLRMTGRPDAALAEVRRGLEVDPQNAFFQQQLAMQLASTGRYEEAIERLQRLLSTNPGYGPAYGRLWEAYFKTNREDAAVEAAVRGVDLELGEVLTRTYAESGYAAAMRRGAEMLVARSRDRYVAPVSVARLYVHAGDLDRALDWLDKAVEAHSSTIAYTTIHSDFEALWNHPRFLEIRRQINLDR